MNDKYKRDVAAGGLAVNVIECLLFVYLFALSFNFKCLLRVSNCTKQFTFVLYFLVLVAF